MSIPETVTELLEPVVATLDVELLDVEWNGNSLRVVVDSIRAPGEKADKTNGITTEQLADVNRLISPILDQHDPVPGRYTLEVSSPGVERKLTKPEHFRRAIGEQVVVKMQPHATPRRVKGELRSVADDGASIAVVGEEIDGIDQNEPSPITLDLASIQKARTSFDWGPTPKPGSKQGKKKNKQNKQQNTEQQSKTASADESAAEQAQLNSEQLKRDKDPS